MGLPEVTPEDWMVIDGLLAKSQVIEAIMIVSKRLGPGRLADAKSAVGMRFYDCFPELHAAYRDIADDD